MSDCYVSAADYAAVWEDIGRPLDQPDIWTGADRRILTDRRQIAHERRWEASRGRRFRMAGRRASDLPRRS